MQFLFNNVVFQLDDPIAVLSKPGFPLPAQAARKLRPSQIGELLRDAAFHRPDIAESAPDKARALAALIALNVDANAVLVVRPGDAAHPGDVHLRFANVALEVLGRLQNLQSAGRLTPRGVDAAVWARAA